MLFTSYSFAALVVASLVLYYLIPRRFQWTLLLAASCVFYVCSGPENMVFIALTAVSTWFAALRIQGWHESRDAYLREHKKEMTKEERKAYKAHIKSRQWKWLLACLFLNLGILAVLKYTNFAISNVNALLKAAGSGRQLDFLSLALPMGISFYTFMSAGYLIDVYRGKYPAERNAGRFALFVSFFPQVVQGPISRFDDLNETLGREHAFEWRNVSFGLQRVLWGYFKKMVVADRILTAVNVIIQDPQTYGGIYVFLGMMFYALELYADFTGGIDITIGVAQMFGVRVQENFIRPYFSKNITEYWRRWHISMGAWFTDYIFYPISVCQPMLKFNRFARKHFGEHVGKRAPVYAASFAVWFATGIWHGAAWNFIVWGLLNFAVIMISQELEPLYKRFHRRFPSVGKTFPYRLFQVVRTVLLMSCLRMLDCYRNVPLTFRMFWDMVTRSRLSQLFDGRFGSLGLSAADYALLFVCTAVMIGVSLAGRSGSVREKIAEKPLAVRFASFYLLFMAIVIFGAYGVGFDSSQFIYNQF